MAQAKVLFTHEELGEIEVEVSIGYPAGREAGIGWDIQAVVGVETEIEYDPETFFAYLESSGRYDEFDQLVRDKAD